MRPIALEQRFPELDGLRGSAIFMVFLFHCLPSAGIPWIDRLLTPRNSGWIGVDLFFALSGFLITRILIGLKPRKDRARRFYVRRTLRIFPLYFLALALAFFVFPLSGALRDDVARLPGKAWFFAYSFNLHILVHDSWPRSAFLNHFWSICVEEQFYLLWPWLVFATSLRRLPLMMFGVAGISVAAKFLMWAGGWRWPSIYAAPFGRMDGFALGGLAAYAHAFWPEALALARARAAFRVSFAALAFAAWLRGGLFIGSRVSQASVTPVLALFFSSSILLLLLPGGAIVESARGVMRWPWLRWLGKYSYGIYVYHWLAYHAVANLGVFGLDRNREWRNFLLVLGGSLAAAFLSFHLVEQPILNLRRGGTKDESQGMPEGSTEQSRGAATD